MAAADLGVVVAQEINRHRVLTALDPPSTWSVANACARFTDSPQLFYDIYRNLSGATHPSYGTILAYLDASPEGAVGVEPDRRRHTVRRDAARVGCRSIMGTRRPERTAQ